MAVGDGHGVLKSQPAAVEALVVERRLRSSRDLEELRARASEEACAFCGFGRAVLLAVGDGRLTAAGEAVEHESSDALRRRALAHPTELVPGSDEAEVVRRADGGVRGSSRGTSILGAALGLEHFVLAPVVPEDRTVALLVVDRGGTSVSEDEVVAVEVFAGIVGIALERAVLRARLAELTAEFRHLATSALAMGQEALAAPVTMSTDHGWGAVFPRASDRQETRAVPVGHDLLSEREREVLTQLAAGRSNRDIAAALHLSPDTVKTHVARILRKLGASNRAEAVGRWLAMQAR